MVFIKLTVQEKHTKNMDSISFIGWLRQTLAEAEPEKSP